MGDKRSNLSVIKLAAIIAAPLEIVSLWVFSWIQWGFHTRPDPSNAMAQWSMSGALIFHLPAIGLLSIVGGGGPAYWPILFLSGYCEFLILIAALIWGTRTLKGISLL
jgi:hypothetical protein